MNLIRKLTTFKVVFFQLDKDLRKQGEEEWGGVVKAVHREITASDNKRSDAKQDDDSQRDALLQHQTKMIDQLDDQRRDGLNVA